MERCGHHYFKGHASISTCFLEEGHDGAHAYVGINSNQGAMIITVVALEGPLVETP